MADEQQNNIIIKKVKKVTGGGHHGGAWKVAYADFVTAMMAFFLLLWLISATTEEQKQGIAEYFSPTKSIITGSTSGTSVMDKSSSMVSISPLARMAGGSSDSRDQKSPSSADEIHRKREQYMFEQAEKELRQALQSDPELRKLSESILIEQTPEGMRIQLIDQDNHSMFPIGSSEILPETRKILQTIARVVRKMPNQIAVEGHTDAAPFMTRRGNGNWDLSANRASASRHVISDTGIGDDRIFRVSGYADRQLLDKDNPYSSKNRRITVLLLRDSVVNAASENMQDVMPNYGSREF